MTENNSMGNNEGNVEATLKQRGSVYGDYGDVCRTRAKILDELKHHYELVNGKLMPGHVEMMFQDVVLKMVRAASKPEYSDSWHDLAGYATLAEQQSKLVISKER